MTAIPRFSSRLKELSQSCEPHISCQSHAARRLPRILLDSAARSATGLTPWRSEMNEELQLLVQGGGSWLQPVRCPVSCATFVLSLSVVRTNRTLRKR